jgi:carboxypeptidase C (cathepsin A)
MWSLPQLALLVCLTSQPCFAEEVLLSPLLRAGNVSAAREASRVGIREWGGHAGYISTDSQDLDRIWFWLHGAKAPATKACVPLILWMQGGPGQVGALNEMGPYYLINTTTTANRSLTWNRKYAMLFVDQPVESGYSYTKRSPIEYVQTSDQAASHMYTFLLQFFQTFPEYQCSPFYVMGESYGGHYVPHTSYFIHQQNLLLAPTDPAFIHLKGLAIGNPDLDMSSQMPPIADMLFNLGLVDEREREQTRAVHERVVALMMQNKSYESLVEWNTTTGATAARVQAARTTPTPSSS